MNTSRARPVLAAKQPALALQLSLQFARQEPVRSHRPHLPRHRVARWIRAALTLPGDITVRVVDAPEARELNRTYRGRDYATNVLTFDYAHQPVVNADLVLCAPVIEAEALDLGRALDAHYAHLLVHGTLHAQGFDHLQDAEAQAMEARENEILLGLGFEAPYGG